jgi:hypothetical protein
MDNNTPKKIDFIYLFISQCRLATEKTAVLPCVELFLTVGINK